MIASTTVALACYGLVLGFSNGLLQALASAIKLPVLFFLTLVICLPTLYLFNLLFGARLSVRQALAIILAAFTVTACLTLAFAPISLFFLISARTTAMHGSLVQGYPPSLFPRQELVRAGPLAALRLCARELGRVAGAQPA